MSGLPSAAGTVPSTISPTAGPVGRIADDAAMNSRACSADIDSMGHLRDVLLSCQRLNLAVQKLLNDWGRVSARRNPPVMLDQASVPWFVELNRSLLRDEEEKAKIQKELTRLTERLSKINEELARRMQARNEFDQTIQETEAAYMKILESSQTLLHVLKRESVSLTKKQQSSSLSS